MNKNNIDIANIQETHNEKTETVQYENYTIIYGGCEIERNNLNNKNTYRAGVAIAIKNSIKGNITRINRINGRIMEIILKTDKNIKNLSITNSYAPHQGYSSNGENNTGAK